jgi:hypothetical protein
MQQPVPAPQEQEQQALQHKMPVQQRMQQLAPAPQEQEQEPPLQHRAPVELRQQPTVQLPVNQPSAAADTGAPAASDVRHAHKATEERQSADEEPASSGFFNRPLTAVRKVVARYFSWDKQATSEVGDDEEQVAQLAAISEDDVAAVTDEDTDSLIDADTLVANVDVDMDADVDAEVDGDVGDSDNEAEGLSRIEDRRVLNVATAAMASSGVSSFAPEVAGNWPVDSVDGSSTEVSADIL